MCKTLKFNSISSPLLFTQWNVVGSPCNITVIDVHVFKKWFYRMHAACSPFIYFVWNIVDCSRNHGYFDSIETAFLEPFAYRRAFRPSPSLIVSFAKTIYLQTLWLHMDHTHKHIQNDYKPIVKNYTPYKSWTQLKNNEQWEFNAILLYMLAIQWKRGRYFVCLLFDRASDRIWFVILLFLFVFSFYFFLFLSLFLKVDEQTKKKPYINAMLLNMKVLWVY